VVYLRNDWASCARPAVPRGRKFGRLVALLKRGQGLAKEKKPLILSTAPQHQLPGDKRPVGTNLAVIVTEPTFGVHDLKRVLALCEHFSVPAAVIINKADLNPDQARAIETYCREKNYMVIGKLPHDAAITEAMVQGKAVTEYRECELSEKLKTAWKESACWPVFKLKQF
jgi:MinD superfamily P-loop ATPase